MVRRRFMGGGVTIVISVVDGVTENTVFALLGRLLWVWDLVMHCHLGLISFYTGSEDGTVKSSGFQCGQTERTGCQGSFPGISRSPTKEVSAEAKIDFVEISESKMLAGRGGPRKGSDETDRR
ncbi:hypothetical protein SADUNF_Sadunf15G0013900 [Salix dunnii]|uniref:Uncharacterized protein n=1 Tax=Salix dunnii TaxID=1413687 RepID=A0A835JBK2_9ROSI|nr:hypothetical protein SADUNF_Sadunf15G0013900 [Salix dunnii]